MDCPFTQTFKPPLLTGAKGEEKDTVGQLSKLLPKEEARRQSPAVTTAVTVQPGDNSKEVDA